MPLVVEDGTGLTTANSYVSEADATAYLTDYGNAADWTGLADSTQREIRLLQATRFLDAEFGSFWKGTRANETQALDWPRCYVYDRDGFLIDDNSLPTALVNACIVLAESAATEDLMPDQANPGDIKRKKSKVGSLEQDIEYAGSQSLEKFYRLAEALLEDLLEPRNQLSRA